MSATEDQWIRFQEHYTWFDTIGLGLDFSRTSMPADFPAQMRGLILRAFAQMRALEGGALANPDENRMVGHYWLRNSELAPTHEIRQEIESTIASVKQFASDVHSGITRGHNGTFKNLLLIGIGGSALGPQFVSHALSHPKTDRLRFYSIDNTDPDGFDRVLAQLEGELGRTLCIVVSKSGGTKETRNAMIEVEMAYQRAQLLFSSHAIAVTSCGSQLDNHAKNGLWLKTFPMWDWIGGRTSELSAVGLLPAALQGFDIDAMLCGAREVDNVSRMADIASNPAMQMALFIYYIGNGSGSKVMAVLPYKDRLELFSRYLQQLVMESIGKAVDLDGHSISQGLTVFGNKGSTDQHAYIQQLRDGLVNFFCVFIWILRDRDGIPIEVEKQITSGDYLSGFLLGTREALFERGRESVLVTLKEADAFHVGVLIGLFERIVGYYASLINVNAYHQPGVEAGKKAASKVIEIQQMVIECLSAESGAFLTVSEIVSRIRIAKDADTVFRVSEHLAANGRITGRNTHLPAKASFASG